MYKRIYSLSIWSFAMIRCFFTTRLALAATHTHNALLND
ncbi:hypothetical protein GVAMD_0771 [Gardnerella vaginalis AMD]|nr:hypothetical protein GVAMD_0771 [Gardnerella vaginalis AMD]